MIKTFEQFVSTMYGRHVNEAFQSSKLRNIIKQHGKPKYRWDNKMLFDLKDDEIVDVLDSRDEYFNKYSDNNDGFGQATFIIELKDGAVIVISNLDILKNGWDDFGNFQKRKEDVFKKRHAERHKGNLGKGGDDIHKKHLENVNKIENKRLAEKLKKYIPEIADKVKSILDDIDISEYDGGKEEIERDIKLGGEEYVITLYFNVENSNGSKKYGAYYYDITLELEGFDICYEKSIYVTDEDLGMKEEHSELFKPFVEEDVEGEIYDYYELYGVNRSDFV